VIEDGPRIIWEVGDRVALDHWRGVVVEVYPIPYESDIFGVFVQWDHGPRGRYYEHVVEPEKKR